MTMTVDNYEISQDLRLTPAEARRLVKLLNNKQVKQIAYEEGVSPAAVNHTLDSIRCKVELNKDLHIGYLPTTKAMVYRLLERDLIKRTYD